MSSHRTISSFFLSRNLSDHIGMWHYIQSGERKKYCQTRILYLAKLFLKVKEKCILSWLYKNH